jgi:uncharacterized membrane protein
MPQAFPRRSRLLPSITEALLKVSESGQLQELENNMIASEKCEDVKSENESLSLSPNSFLVLFILTGGTSTIALLVYIVSVENSMFRHNTLWRLMMVVIKHWRSQKRRYSRRIGDVVESPSI